MAASEGLKAAAFEAGADPALIIGADGSLKAANEAAESLFGQGLGLLSRTRFHETVASGDKVGRLMARAIETGSPARFSVSATARTGTAPSARVSAFSKTAT